MSGPALEHWFDRLAAPQTRRQVLKAALAGAVLTLPFARSAPARAANPNSNGNPYACGQGCDYASHVQYQRAEGACNTGLSVGIIATDALMVLGFMNPLIGAAAEGAALINRVACHNQNLLVEKAMQYNCLLPDCPGFDPSGPGGPCPPNAKFCCPCLGCLGGYTPCAVCCSPTGDGCGSGLTECGGGTP
jgi:hypothetical protein